MLKSFVGTRAESAVMTVRDLKAVSNNKHSFSSCQQKGESFFSAASVTERSKEDGITERQIRLETLDLRNHAE